MNCRGCDGKGWRGIRCKPEINIEGLIMRKCSRCLGSGKMKKVFIKRRESNDVPSKD